MRQNSNLIQHKCYIVPGDSGGPIILFNRKNNDYEILGIESLMLKSTEQKRIFVQGISTKAFYHEFKKNNFNSD